MPPTGQGRKCQRSHGLSCRTWVQTAKCAQPWLLLLPGCFLSMRHLPVPLTCRRRPPRLRRPRRRALPGAGDGRSRRIRNCLGAGAEHSQRRNPPCPQPEGIPPYRILPDKTLIPRNPACVDTRHRAACRLPRSHCRLTGCTASLASRTAGDNAHLHPPPSIRCSPRKWRPSWGPAMMSGIPLISIECRRPRCSFSLSSNGTRRQSCGLCELTRCALPKGMRGAKTTPWRPFAFGCQMATCYRVRRGRAIQRQ